MSYEPPIELEFFEDELIILHDFIEWLKDNERIISPHTMMAGPVPDLRPTEVIVSEYLGIEHKFRSYVYHPESED